MKPRISLLGPFPQGEDGDYCLAIFHLSRGKVKKVRDRVNSYLEKNELPHLSWRYDEATKSLYSRKIPGPGKSFLRIVENFLKNLGQRTLGKGEE